MRDPKTPMQRATDKVMRETSGIFVEAFDYEEGAPARLALVEAVDECFPGMAIVWDGGDEPPAVVERTDLDDAYRARVNEDKTLQLRGVFQEKLVKHEREWIEAYNSETSAHSQEIRDRASDKIVTRETAPGVWSWAYADEANQVWRGRRESEQDARNAGINSLT